MARQIKTIDYDLNNDILFLSDGEKVKASLDIGDFILDVNSDNFICGIKKDILEKIQNIKMSVNYKTNYVYVLLMITFQKEDQVVNIPIPLTLGLGHKSSRQELLVYN